MPHTPLPICVLIAAYNGAVDLPAQLDSIADQTCPPVRVLVSDDGSTDGTCALLEGWDALPCTVLDGPCQGYAPNFLSLITRAPKDHALAFADQDDIWLPGKLARAADALSALPADRPALYCARRINWWPETDRRVPSRRYEAPPCFGNALVENIAPGNTIVLNAAAADLARAAAPHAGGIYAHDWWLYQLVTGAGGTVVHDPEPVLLYRQHGGNAIGAGEGLGAGLRNKAGALRGLYAARLTAQAEALEGARDLLTEPARAQLDAFRAGRAAPLPARLKALRAAGVRRQGKLSQLSFWGGAALGRV